MIWFFSHRVTIVIQYWKRHKKKLYISAALLIGLADGWRNLILAISLPLCTSIHVTTSSSCSSSNFLPSKNTHFPPFPSSHMIEACECKTFNCSRKLFKWKFYISESLTNIANIGFLLKLEHNFTCPALLVIQKPRKHFIIYSPRDQKQ